MYILLLCLLQLRKNQSRTFLSGLFNGQKDRNIRKIIILLSSGDHISLKFSNSIFFTITKPTQLVRTVVVIEQENKTRYFQVISASNATAVPFLGGD